MDKKTVAYSESDRKAMVEFIRECFEDDFLSFCPKEEEDDYISPDFFFAKNCEGDYFLISRGMGARDMNAPDGQEKRVELIMGFSKDMRMRGLRKRKVNQRLYPALEQMRNLCHSPFADDSWIGAGTCATTSYDFRRQFGYEYLLLMPQKETVTLPDSGEVQLLFAVPLYEEEVVTLLREERDIPGIIDALAVAAKTDHAFRPYIDRARPHLPAAQKTA